jgi:hypothetical protein
VPPDRFLHKKAGHSKKVSGLTHFEHRVWSQYILSADDFGVMRASAIALQADNDALAECASPDIQAAIERIVSVELVHLFEHQGMRYLYQLDWQDYQKVTWPARTIHPSPSGQQLERCTPATRFLFTIHPGGKKLPKRDDNGGGGGGDDYSGSTSEVLLGTTKNDSAPVRGTASVVPRTATPTHTRRTSATRAGARWLGLGLPATANGNGSEGGPGETIPPLDVWLRELQGRYPQQGVTSGYLTESAFLDAITDDGRDPRVVFADMLAHLDNQCLGYQWRVRRMIPKLEKWLREGLWKQLHDAAPPLAIVSERTVHNEMAGDAFVNGGTREH